MLYWGDNKIEWNAICIILITSNYRKCLHSKGTLTAVSNKSYQCGFVSFSVCHLLEQKVYGILGAFQSCALSTIQSYTDTFKVPFISLSMPQVSSSAEPYQLYIRPSYIKGLLDIVSQKSWNKIFYIYESDEGMQCICMLFQYFYVFHTHTSNGRCDCLDEVIFSVLMFSAEDQRCSPRLGQSAICKSDICCF
jgi:hypothetical protein